MKRALVAGVVLYVAAASLKAATFTVTNTNDSGVGSLRQAILDANANGGADIIEFTISGSSVHTITPVTALPPLSDPVFINGYSQPGSSANTDPFSTNAVLLIELDGSAIPGQIGIQLLGSGATGCTVQGLVINRFSINTAIEVNGGASDNVIRGNFLGTDPTGSFAQANFSAIQVGTSSPNTMIGGTSPADRNLVSGNTAGVFFGVISLSSGATVQGNLIGTDATGTKAIPNVVGLGAFASGTLIGGTAPGAGNVISGNNPHGIWIQADPVVYGNRVGTTADGTGPLGNAVDGIAIHESNDATIGGLSSGQANEIAFNGGSGVSVSNSGINNSIRGNSIHDNGGLGIDLNGDGPNFNDAGDADLGANNLDNFPILQSVIHGVSSTEILGKFNSTASTTFDLDFYTNPACSNFPREFLEGETYLGSSLVATDGSGNAAIDVTLLVATDAGARISATATDPNGNTSEFSQRIVFQMTSSTSGPASGGTGIAVSGTDFADPTTMTIGGVSTPVTFVDDHTLQSTSPALAPGTVSDLIVATPDGTMGTLPKAWVSDFLDVPGSQQFYTFVTKLVSNGITAGVGGGFYGVDQPTLRQQMAVFLLKARHGLCYTPPPCTPGFFADVACPSTFADWIEALANEGITGGCGGGNYCPTNPVRRDQMAVFLLKAEHGSAYVPPACAPPGVFPDVLCPGTFTDWVEQLAAEAITGGCGGGNYCPGNPSTRGQMAVFITKTFNLQ